MLTLEDDNSTTLLSSLVQAQNFCDASASASATVCLLNYSIFLRGHPSIKTVWENTNKNP